MPERSRKKKPGPKDLNELAKPIVDRGTSDDQRDNETEDTSGKNPAAVALGRLGGKKGGPARAERLTPEQRADISRRAAKARWARHKKQDRAKDR